jgi:hypothetical protein
MHLVHQFEGKVVLDSSELDSKSDSWTPNWLGPPPCCACFLGSPAPPWCPTCPPWSTSWFLITIKSLGSNLFSRSLAGEHKNKITWWHSCCAHDLVIGPCTSIGVVVSDVVMSSSVTELDDTLPYLQGVHQDNVWATHGCLLRYHVENMH